MALWWKETPNSKRWREILDPTGNITKRFKLLLTLQTDGFSPMDVAQFYHDEYTAILALYNSYVKALQESSNVQKSKPLTTGDALGLCGVLRQALLSTPAEVDGMQQNFLWSEILAFVQPQVEPSVRLAGIGLLALFVHVFMDDPTDDRLMALLSALEWGPFLRGAPDATPPEMPFCCRLPAAFVPVREAAYQPTEAEALRTFEAVIETAKGLALESHRYSFWWGVIKRWLLGCLYPAEERLLAAVPAEPYPAFPSPCSLPLHQLLLNFLTDGMACTLPPGAKCAALLGTDSDTFITRTILRLSFAYGLPAGRRCIFTTLEVLTNWVASELTEFPLRYHSPASFADDVDGMCLNVLLLASTVFDWARADLPKETAEAFQECCLAVLQLYFQLSHRQDLRPETHGQIFDLYVRTVRVLADAPAAVSPAVADAASRLVDLMWILNADPTSPGPQGTDAVARHGHPLTICLLQAALRQPAAAASERDLRPLRLSGPAGHRCRDESSGALVDRMFKGAVAVPRPTDPVLLAFHDHLALDDLGGPALQRRLTEILGELEVDRAGALWRRLLGDLYLAEAPNETVAAEQVRVVCDVVGHLLSLPLSDSPDPAPVPIYDQSHWDLMTLHSPTHRADRPETLTAAAVLDVVGPRLLRASLTPHRASAALACEALSCLLTFAAPGELPERFRPGLFHALAVQLQEHSPPYAVLLRCLPTTERNVNAFATEQPGCGVLLLPLFHCAKQVLQHPLPETPNVVAAALRAVMTVTLFAYHAPTAVAHQVEAGRWVAQGTLEGLRPALVEVLEGAAGALTTSRDCVFHVWAVLLLLTMEVQTARPSSSVVQRLLTVICAALVHRKLDSGFAAHAAIRCFAAVYLRGPAPADPAIVAFVHSALCTAALVGMKEYRHKPRGAVLCSLLLTLRAAVLATPAAMLLRLHVAPAVLCNAREVDALPVAQDRPLMLLVTDTLRYAISSFPTLPWEVCRPRGTEAGVPIAHPPPDGVPPTPSHGTAAKCRSVLAFPTAVPGTAPVLHVLWWCDSTGNLVKEMDPLPGTTSADIRDLGRCILAQLLEQVGSPTSSFGRSLFSGLGREAPPVSCRHEHPGPGCFHLSFNNRLVSYCNGPGADAVHIMSRTPVAAYAWSVQYRRPPSPPPATPVEAPAAAPRTSPRPARPELRPGGAERARGGLENANLRDMWALVQRQPLVPGSPGDGVAEPPELQDLLSHWPTSRRSARALTFPPPLPPPTTPPGTGDAVKRLLATGVMDMYAERRSTMCVAEEATLHPLISKLDATALRDRVHVAVVYVGPQQDSWAQALRNEHCSAGLAAFLAALGCETPARGLLGPASERLILSPAHRDLPAFADATVEAVFHVLPRYPVIERTTKLDTCDVVFAWSDGLAFPQGSTIRHRPTLRLCPLPSGLYYVQSNSTMGPAVGGTLLDAALAPEFVRQTLLNAKLGRGQSAGCQRLRELSSFGRSITDMTRRTLPHLTLATPSPSPLPSEPSTPCSSTTPSRAGSPPSHGGRSPLTGPGCGAGPPPAAGQPATLTIPVPP